MYYLDLLVGAGIGLGIGILLMILVHKRSETETTKLLEGNEFDDQIHESGFLEIPTRQLVHENSLLNKEKTEKFRKRIFQFKNRNRFYK